ncbi:MAG: hypothetical protein EBR09_01710 [Proteobacteria bacterium]|nr:hypothetical protein [Pseudomonadota bacterium]
MELTLPLESLRYLQNNQAFLGREFLTWLWYYTESGRHEVNLGELGIYKLYVDDRLVLTSSSGSAHEQALKGGTPAYAAEALVALQSGKMVHDAKFILQDNEKQWMWNMRADDLALRSVRLPTVQAPDASTHMQARIANTQLLVDVVETLFRMYLDLRMSKGFDAELRRIHDWMSTKHTHVG